MNKVPLLIFEPEDFGAEKRTVPVKWIADLGIEFVSVPERWLAENGIKTTNDALVEGDSRCQS